MPRNSARCTAARAPRRPLREEDGHLLIRLSDGTEISGYTVIAATGTPSSPPADAHSAIVADPHDRVVCYGVFTLIEVQRRRLWHRLSVRTGRQPAVGGVSTTAAAAGGIPVTDATWKHRDGPVAIGSAAQSRVREALRSSTHGHPSKAVQREVPGHVHHNL